MPRIRKSTQQHLLAGTEPQATAPDVSFIPAGRPPIPKDLKGIALDTFKHICKVLKKRNALTAGDGEAIRLYAIQFARHVRAHEHLEDEGELVMTTVLDKGGNPIERLRQNQYLKIAQDCETKMAGYLDRLGLTSLNRDRVKPTTRPQRKDVLPPNSVGAIMARHKAMDEARAAEDQFEDEPGEATPERKEPENVEQSQTQFDSYTDFNV